MSAKIRAERPSQGFQYPQLRTVLYVLSGPLIWLATLLILSSIGASGCAGTGVTLAVQLAGVSGCIGVMYHGLDRARRGRSSERERLPHFFAAGLAALGMVGIGATTLVALLATSC